MYAIELDRVSRIIFSPVPVPEDVRDELDGLMPATVRDGVTLDVPAGVGDRRPGEDAPEAILCVSRSDPDHYRVFKFARDIDRAAFTLAGFSWSVLPSAERWRGFVREYAKLDRMAREAVGTEAPDEDEEFEAVGHHSPAGAA